MLVLAISNGYVGNIACMYGPKVVKPEYQVQNLCFKKLLYWLKCCIYVDSTCFFLVQAALIICWLFTCIGLFIFQNCQKMTIF